MREDLIGLERRPEWEAALDGVPHGYWHSWSACEAASISSGWPSYLYVAESEAGRIVCPLAERLWDGIPDFTTPIGFSGFASTSGALPADFPHVWRKFMGSRNAVCAYLALHPLYAPAWPEGGEIPSTPLYLLDLRKSPDVWLDGIDANRRRSIRAWERSGKSWIRERSALQRFLVANHRQFMQSVHASDASFHRDRALEVFGMDPAVELVGAGDAEGICSVAGFGATRWGVELLFHVSTREGRVHSAALMWWAVMHYHALQLPYLDLGGGLRSSRALSDAKLRYRPQVRDLHVLKQVFDVDLYDRLCAASGKSSTDPAGYFPAYRTPAPHPEREEGSLN